MGAGEEDVVAKLEDRVPVRCDRLVLAVDPANRDLVDEWQGMELLAHVALVANGGLEQTGLGVGQQVNNRRTLDHRPQDTGLNVEGVEDLNPRRLQTGKPSLVDIWALLTGDHPADPVLLRQEGQAGVLPVV